MKTKKWTKVLSLVLAFAMIFVLALPVAQAEGEKTNTVTLHKLLLKPDDLKNWNSETIQKAFAGWKLVGNQVQDAGGNPIYETPDHHYVTDSTPPNTPLKVLPKGYDATQDMSQFQAILTGLGKTAPSEIEGAYFVWQDADHLKDGSGKDLYIKGLTGNLTSPALNGGALQYTTNIDEAMGGLTGTNGIKFTTSGMPDGNYQINEIHNKSTYVGPKGETLTDNKAVPVVLKLPLINDTGVVPDAHVYPKNTENAPTTTKTIEDKDRIIKDKKYSEKDVYGYGVGDKVPYNITATIPAQAKYETAYWTDQMTEGLTFINNSTDPVVVKLDGSNLPTADYKIEPYGNGFKLSLTASGLEKINGQANAVTLTIAYKALMNSAAVTAKTATPGEPEANDVTFHYGNNPDHGNTPVPNKPSNKEMLLEKNWVKADGAALTPPAGTKAKFTIYDAQTGDPVIRTVNSAQVVYSIDLDGETDPDEPAPWQAKFTGLDDNREYIIKEDYVTGYSAEYSIDGAGKIKVKNWKDNNPKPIDPEEPRVENYGKKFVKTNGKTGNDLKRLAGAQFVVYKNDASNKPLYMVRKSGGATTQLANDLATAKTALDNAIKLYNERVNDDNITKLLNDVNDAQKAYNNAFIAAKTEYEWSNDIKKATVLFSNTDGQFEVTGLAPGTYFLEETMAPKGYAKISSPIQFKVDKDSYYGHTDGINYDPKVPGTIDAQKVENKAVTIPETGGIGTVIFTVVGIVMVAGAFIILRKNREDQYA